MAAGKSYSIKAIIHGVDRLTAPVRKMMGGVHRTLGGGLRRIGSLARGVTRAITGILGPLGLLAGGGIVAGLGGLLKGFIDTGDSIGEFAAQVGIATGALQEWEYAAERSGTGGATFRKSLEFFSKTLGNARANGGKFTSTLAKMPPAFRKALLGAESTDEALRLSVGALGSVTDESDRAALATALFGKSGARMALLAAQGADGIQRLREEAQRLGVVLDEDAVRAAGEADDQLIQFKGTIRGLKTAIASELLPVFLPLLRDLTEWIRSNRELIGQKVGDAVKSVVEWIKRVDFGAVIEGVKSFVGWVSDLVEKVGGIGPALGIIAAINFAPLLASLGPVGLVLAGILALALGINNALDNMAGRGKTKTTIAGAKAGAAARTGDAGILRGAGASAASGLRDIRVAAAARDPLGDQSATSAMLGGMLAPFVLTSGVGPAPVDVVRGNKEAAAEFVRALAAELNAGPPTRGTLDTLKLDVTIRDDRVEVQQRPAPGRREPFLPRSFR